MLISVRGFLLFFNTPWSQSYENRVFGGKGKNGADFNISTQKWAGRLSYIKQFCAFVIESARIIGFVFMSLHM